MYFSLSLSLGWPSHYRELMCTASLLGKKVPVGQTAPPGEPHCWFKQATEMEREREPAKRRLKRESSVKSAEQQCSAENSVSKNPQQGLQFLNNSWALALGWWELLRLFNSSAEGVELSIHCQLSEENIWAHIHIETHTHTQIHSLELPTLALTSVLPWVFAEIIKIDCRTMGDEFWSYSLFCHNSRSSYQVSCKLNLGNPSPKSYLPKQKSLLNKVFGLLVLKNFFKKMSQRWIITDNFYYSSFIVFI